MINATKMSLDLIDAVKTENVELAQKLLDSGANANVKDHTGVTPLMYAAKQGNEALVKALIAARVDVNARSGKDNTCLPSPDEFKKTLTSH